MTERNPLPEQPPNEPQEPGLKDVLRSVLSAATGIQSSKNQERDFKHGKARTYIIAGIIYTVLFIGTVFTIVKLVLRQAGY